MADKIYPIAHAKEDTNEDESVMLSLFLDFLLKDAIKNPDQLVPYTQKMSDEMDELLANVVFTKTFS
ncbi:hypothetical protein [Iningainema tapete]|uniref:Uncharacterized protein n=1 Tax=Iningainema tapete BLCC-T55 TaxID=2748662 RepID=A0A8J6XAC3_9CYAN|nr:hypothetical protein [Iningainema tapete]MBD2771095.1 hypothetical protein [Iningainema tapete BLCC-T55]